MPMYFVNVDYNYKSPNGQSEFCWTVREFDLSELLSDQLHAMLEEIGHMKSDVFNLNLTAFTPVDTQNTDNRQCDKLKAALERIAGINWRDGLVGLDNPTDFAERQAALFALGTARDIAREAIK